MNIYSVKFKCNALKGMIIPSFVKTGVSFLECTHDYGESVGEFSPYDDLGASGVMLEVEYILRELEASNSSEDCYKVIDKCKSAVTSQVCTDYISKRDKVPLWQVYANYLCKNPKQVKIGIYASGCSSEKSFKLDDLREEVSLARELGANVFKFRIPVDGNKSHQDRVKNPEIVKISDLRVIGGFLQRQGFIVAVDLGCRLKEIEELKRINEIAEWRFIEEPFRRDEMNKVKGLGVEVAGGEHCRSLQEFTEYRGAVKRILFQPDMNMMPLVELRRCLNKEETHIIPHNWTTPISCGHNYAVAVAVEAEMMEFPVINNPYYKAARMFECVSSGRIVWRDGLCEYAWSRLKEVGQIKSEGSREIS